MTTELLGLALLLPPDVDTATVVHLTRLAGRLRYAAVHLRVEPGRSADPALVDALVAAAGDAMVVVDDGTTPPNVVRGRDLEEVARARAAADADGHGAPVAVVVPVSIGRTRNEAVARADREPRFAGEGHPRLTGIFGTFEQAQEQVLALARAGAEVLVVDLPLERDAADVLAQVKALVVGATPALYSR